MQDSVRQVRWLRCEDLTHRRPLSSKEKNCLGGSRSIPLAAQPGSACETRCCPHAGFVESTASRKPAEVVTRARTTAPTHDRDPHSPVRSRRWAIDERHGEDAMPEWPRSAHADPARRPTDTTIAHRRLSPAGFGIEILQEAFL